MPTFRVVLRRSDFYVNEIEAKDYEDAKKKGRDEIWHGRFFNKCADYSDEDVYEVEELTTKG